MGSLVRFLYYLSILFFIGNMFYAYYQFPEYVAISFSENTGLREYKSKATLFYTGAGLFLLVTILLSLLKLLLKSFPFEAFPFPNKSFWLASADAKESLVNVHVVWINSFGALVNLLIGTIFLSLLLVNVVGFGTFNQYLPLFVGFLIVISLWWIVLVARLLYRKLEL